MQDETGSALQLSVWQHDTSKPPRIPVLHALLQVFVTEPEFFKVFLNKQSISLNFK
jgi:hypothetical protein